MAPEAPGQPDLAMLVCDVWPGIYTDDPQVDWRLLETVGPVAVTLPYAAGVSGPAELPAVPALFPPQAFPEPGDEASTRTMSGNGTASHRVMTGQLVDTLLFYDLESAAPGLTWQRLRLTDDGPHETLLTGSCRRTGEV